MTLDGFLTFLTIVLAAYAVMPAVNRLRIALHRVGLMFISIISLIFVIYFLFYSMLEPLCPNHIINVCNSLTFAKDDPINPGQAAFAVVAAWLILASFFMVRTKLSPRSLPTLSKLVSKLAHEQKYSDLVELITPQLPFLSKAASRNLKLARLHDYFVDLEPRRASIRKIQSATDAGRTQTIGRSIVERTCSVVGHFASKLAVIVPSGRKAEEAAQDILRIIFGTPALTEYIANYRPSFGIQFLSLKTRGAHEFSDAFLAALISSPQSILYREIKDNMNLARCGYSYPQHNELLHFLFADARTAESLASWNPIGEHIVAGLRADHDPDYIVFLNGRAEFFSKNEKWKDKTFIGMQFFDLMVSAAACQGVKWHMWLYHFTRILRKLVAIYDISADEIDTTDEWPTRTSYLIYALFSMLLDWIEIVNCLPEESPHLVVNNVNMQHQNDNIPKSAALTLGVCCEVLFRAQNVDESFRRYIHNMIMRTIRDLDRNGNKGCFRTVTINAIVQRGPLGADPAYGDVLSELWRYTDPVVKMELDDYEAALSAAYP